MNGLPPTWLRGKQGSGHGNDRFGSKREEWESSRSVRFTAGYGSADEASEFHEFMT
jgi:hypothetical protein